jgi:hypothetical protein
MKQRLYESKTYIDHKAKDEEEEGSCASSKSTIHKAHGQGLCKTCVRFLFNFLWVILVKYHEKKIEGCKAF